MNIFKFGWLLDYSIIIIDYSIIIIKQPAKPEDAHVERKRLFLYLNDSCTFNALFYNIIQLICGHYLMKEFIYLEVKSTLFQQLLIKLTIITKLIYLVNQFILE